MTKKVLAIIPARGGSKGLPKKNILDLQGKPLITWSIEASLNSKYIDTTIVTSDDDKILEIAKSLGVTTIKRPASLASDTSSSESVIKHVLDSINDTYEYIILLQPTSPLRKAQHIDEAFSLIFDSNSDSLISVVETDNKILKAFLEEDGYIKGISNNFFPFMNRQNLPKTYISNGAIYIINRLAFMKKNTFLTNKTIKYIMNEESSIDIDTIEDLIEAEKRIKNYKKI